MRIRGLYGDGEFLSEDVVTNSFESQIDTWMERGISNIKFVSHGLEFPTSLSVLPTFVQGVRNVLALAIETNYSLKYLEIIAQERERKRREEEERKNYRETLKLSSEDEDIGYSLFESFE